MLFMDSYYCISLIFSFMSTLTPTEIESKGCLLQYWFIHVTIEFASEFFMKSVFVPAAIPLRNPISQYSPNDAEAELWEWSLTQSTQLTAPTILMSDSSLLPLTAVA